MHQKESITLKFKDANDHISKLFNNTKYSDFKFLFSTSDNVIHCHKNILCCSEVIELMFNSEMQEGLECQAIIDTDDDDETLFTLMIKSLYTSSLTLEHEQDIVPFIVMCDKYSLHSLEQICINYLTCNINEYNCASVWLLDEEKSKYKKLYESARDFMYFNTELCYRTDAYCVLSVDRFKRFMEESVCQGIGELVMDSIVTWVNCHRETRALETIVLLQTASNSVKQYPPRNGVLLDMWCAPHGLKHRKLIYKASRDGFGCKSFHSRVDNRGPSLTVIRTDNGSVFGGFTSISWTSPKNNAYYEDKQAWLFSLKNAIGHSPAKIPITDPAHAVLHNQNELVIFGNGCDLRICDMSNLCTNSFTNFGTSFALEGFEEGSNKAKSFLAGAKNFKVVEIEVYIKK